MISVPGCLELKIRSRSVRAEVSFLILFIQLAIGAVAPRHLLCHRMGKTHLVFPTKEETYAAGQ